VAAEEEGAGLLAALSALAGGGLAIPNVRKQGIRITRADESIGRIGIGCWGTDRLEKVVVFREAHSIPDCIAETPSGDEPGPGECKRLSV